MKTRLVIVGPEPGVSETFLRAHIDRIPAHVTHIHGSLPANGQRRSQSIWSRGFRKAGRLLTGRSRDREITSAYLEALRKSEAAAVLAEYGPNGVRVMQACRTARVPLVVHFHGYDASVNAVIDQHRLTYQEMFRFAGAVIAVSRQMRHALIDLGATPERVFYNPCGVEVSEFEAADPAQAPPTFVSVGRFVEKKAPHTTLRAFAGLVRRRPEARLRMIGDGPLLESSRALAVSLGIGDHVAFLGAQKHAVVADELRRARGFLQHSVEAANGDQEGTPVALLEAGAAGLPSIATRHAGIIDVIVEGETGLLVDEHDADAMATWLETLVDRPALAARLGSAARSRIAELYTMERSITRLWRIVTGVILDDLEGIPRDTLIGEAARD